VKDSAVFPAVTAVTAISSSKWELVPLYNQMYTVDATLVAFDLTVIWSIRVPNVEVAVRTERPVVPTIFALVVTAVAAVSVAIPTIGAIGKIGAALTGI